MDNFIGFLQDIQSNEKFEYLDEAAIKQGVILKLLSLLNWDPFNIDEIQPEYSVDNGKVDFALKFKKTIMAFICFQKDLPDFEKFQKTFLDWAVEEEVKIAVLTNGLVWWFFLASMEGDPSEKRFHVIDIYKENAEESKKGFTNYLSKENITSEKTVKAVEEIYTKRKRMLLINEHLPNAWLKIMNEPEKWLVGIISEVTEDLCGFKPDNETVENFIISEMKAKAEPYILNTGKDSEQDNKKTTKNGKSKSIKSFTFDGKKNKVKSLKDMLLKICDLMYAKHKDDFESIQYITLEGRDCFSDNPHQFFDCKEISSSNIYVDLNLSVISLMNLCKEILTHFGYDESDLILETT